MACGTRVRHHLHGLSKFGFPTRATRVGHMMFPIDEREQALVHPLPPRGREAEWLHIPLDALPPHVHQRGEGRDLLADLGHGLEPGRQLMVAGLTFRSPQPVACSWLSTWAEVWGVESAMTEWMQRQREGL